MRIENLGLHRGGEIVESCDECGICEGATLCLRMVMDVLPGKIVFKVPGRESDVDW